MTVQFCSNSVCRLNVAAICLMASSPLLLADAGAQPPENPAPALKYDPEFPDSMVVATVNSEPITVEEVLEPNNAYSAIPVLALRDPDARRDETPEQRREQRRMAVLFGLQKVVARKLKIIGLKASLSQQQLDELDEGTEEAWREFASGLTAKSEVEQKTRDHELALIKRIFWEDFMARDFDAYLDSKSDEPTSLELHDYYKQNIDNWAYPEGVKWQEISVLCGSDERRADAEARAHDLLARLNAGADFSELARTHSEGITKAKGGLRGWTVPGAFGCQEDEDFLFSAKIGSTSKVISGRDEFHIVRLLDRREPGYQRFAEMESKIRATLKLASFNRLVRKTMQKLHDDAEIKTVFGDEWEFDVPSP